MGKGWNDQWGNFLTTESQIYSFTAIHDELDLIRSNLCFWKNE